MLRRAARGVPRECVASGGRGRVRAGALALLALGCWTAARASGSPAQGDAPTPWNPCAECNLLVGAGVTYKFWSLTDSAVVPIELELADSRWELGAFRMTSGQVLDEPATHPHTRYAALPYWGFSAMRRWRVFHGSWGKLYLGVGGNYRTEADLLVATKWDFAYLIAYRFDLGSERTFVELSIRHWSNAWLRLPDRGQNFMTVMLGF